VKKAINLRHIFPGKVIRLLYLNFLDWWSCSRHIWQITWLL